jgi:hypothetical protein
MCIAARRILRHQEYRCLNPGQITVSFDGSGLLPTQVSVKLSRILSSALLRLVVDVDFCVVQVRGRSPSPDSIVYCLPMREVPWREDGPAFCCN